MRESDINWGTKKIFCSLEAAGSNIYKFYLSFNNLIILYYLNNLFSLFSIKFSKIIFICKHKQKWMPVDM